jgi:undecaprenyl diphosphate synthase
MTLKQLPEHVAIVMDGNGRWAKKRLLPRIAGHKAGTESVKTAIKFCIKQGIKVLTLFAFSTENWFRPDEEVKYLMQLFLQSLEKEVDELHKNDIQLHIVGDLTRLNKTLIEKINIAENVTKNNKGLKLIIALSYSGRWDITEAMRKIAAKIESKMLSIADITDDIVNNNLCFGEFPDPDLFIRTSGEKRLSNFMLWQLAYTELYFTEVLWPDFKEEDFEKALHTYATRKRRFGKIDEGTL